MSNEIKVGDKVRVSKDAPRIYFNRSICSYPEYVFEVREVEDGNADIYYSAGKIPLAAFVIPTKYLIKVDAEAKEPKYKVGDRVRLKDIYYKEELRGRIGTIRKIAGCHIYVEIDSTIYPATIHSLEPYTEPKPKYKIGDKVRKKKWDKDTTISYVEWHGTWQTYVYRFAEQEYGFNCHKEGDITLVSRRAKEPKFQTGDCVKISFEWGELPVGEKLVIKRLETIDCRNAYMYSIEGYGGYVIESMLHSYTEPTEQTEAEENDADNLKKVAEEWANTVSNAIREYGDAMCKIYVEAHNEAYWDAYTADLAKEVALKVANKFNAPEQAADYAVKVAKAVAEGLKRK